MDGGSRQRIGAPVGGAVDNSIIDRMMLRFRPIAPKPPGSVDLPAGSKTLVVSVVRKKRKYTRARKRNENNIDKTKRTRSGGERNEKIVSSVVTLQLFPEMERTEPRESSIESLRFGRDPNNRAIIAETVTEQWVPRVVESWVTVERVSEGGCVEAPVLGRTDVERDTCPWFVSDGWDRILWVNVAYRRLVCGDERDQSAEVRAWLVRKEKLPIPTAFTCRVRLKYTWQGVMKTFTAPCDVWKMDGGGLAWRLDINAALTLTL